MAIKKSTKKSSLKTTDFLKIKEGRSGAISKIVAPHDFQVGVGSDSYRSSLTSTGIIVAQRGFSGSLTRLEDGNPYLHAGSNIALATGSDGSITIAASGFSNNPLTATVAGGLFFDAGTTYDGSASKTLAIDIYQNRGLSIHPTAGLRIDFTSASSVAPATSDRVLIGDAGSSYNAKYCTINDILSLGSAGTLANAITLGNGIEDSAGGVSSYNNTAAITLAVTVSASSGLGVTSDGVRISPSTLPLATVATGDKVLIGDVSDSDNVKYVTAQSIANLATVGTLSNALTAGNGLQLNSGATFDGSAAKTISAKAADATISVGGSGISVLKVPNNLTSSRGISSFTYDGSSSGVGIQVAIDANGGLGFDAADALSLEISNLPSADITINDYIPFYDASGGTTAVSKTTANQLRTLISGDITSVTAGTGLTGGGSTGDLTLAINNNVVATISGSTFTGGVKFDTGLTGSLTKLPDGTSFLRAGSNVSLNTGSKGEITISAVAGGGGVADGNAKYLVLAATSSLSEERVFSMGTGLSASDGGAGNNYTVSVRDSIFASLTGSQFSGNVGVTGSIGSTSLVTSPAFSGSLTHLQDGTSFIKAGNNIQVATSSNGGITITGTVPAATTFFSSPANGYIVTTGSTSFAGSHGASYPTTNVGTDAFFFVSGTIGSANSSTAGTAVFSGDVVVSGTMYGTGTIGPAEDGVYTDGLFTDFISSTPIGTAIDRINEVLLGVAPSAAPALDDMGCGNTGTTAVLSFGSSQSISGYTNVQPSTLSSPSNTLSNIDINGTYSSTTSNNNIRAAAFAGSTTIEGVLNLDVSADGTNYPNYAFGNGDSGTLYLYVNNNSTAIHSTSLGSFASGNSLNTSGSGFISLGAATTGSFSDGSAFTIFQHRTGSFRVSTNDQRNGWNYARVTHVVGSTTNTCNYVSWVNDSDSNALSSDNSAFDSLSMTGLASLSGVKYNTAGSAQYRLRVLNAYRNVYSNSNISFNGTNCSVSSQAFPSINYAGGENETKILHLTGSATINANSLLNESITVSSNVPHPLKSNLSSAGSQSIAGILMWAYSNNSTTTAEYFRAENYRIISGSYTTQASVTAGGNTWDSSKHMSGSNAGYEDGLMFYNRRLYAPVQGGASGDFRNSTDGGSIANGPADNVNYSGITSGTRTFYRYFQNTSGGSQTGFSLTINGSGTIVSNGTSLGTGNISVLVKLPTTSAAQSTGWMDLALAFATGQISDGDGCLEGSLDSSLNATNTVTFGTVFVESNEYVVVKILADASFTGYSSQISVSWS